jgi:hypothetical protein
VEVCPWRRSSISTARSYGSEEAARLLRISRTSAYVLARRWLDTDGVEGLPAVRVGRSIRIPTVAIDRLADPVGTPALVAFRLVDAG